jgi:glycosyltransferase involved in cell wall biosynthesis
VPENGIDTTRFTAVRSRKASRPLRVIFVGRLVTYKGPDMLLEAAESLLARGELTLEFVGTGPLEESLRQFVDERGLQPAVHFAGWVEHAQVQHRLAEADLLALPSIREFGGGVVLEAMAVGLVPLVVNYGGPAELITPRTGFTIELGTRGQIVERLREQLAELVARPELIDERCGPARRRVAQHFTWSAKARQVLGVYARLLGQDSSTEMPASAGPLLPHSRLAKACRSVNKAMAGKKEEAQWLAC